MAADPLTPLELALLRESTDPREDAVLAALRRIVEVLDQSGGDRYAIEARSIARETLRAATLRSRDAARRIGEALG